MKMYFILICDMQQRILGIRVLYCVQNQSQICFSQSKSDYLLYENQDYKVLI